MKKFSLLVVTLLLALSFSALPVMAQDDAESKAYEEWYKVYQAKDYAQAAKLAKEIKAKFPNHPNIKYIDASVTKYQGSLLGEFDTALRAYFATPDAAKLDKVTMTADKYAGEVPDSFIVNFLTARALLNGVVSNHYSDTARFQGYADKALALSSNPTPPTGVTPADYKKNIDQIKAEFPFLLGYKYLGQTPPDLAKAEEYLNSVAMMKVATPGLGWKDHRVYWSRAEIYSKRYEVASKKYTDLPPEKKTAEEGKAILDNEINPLIDKMIIEYARVVATATDPQFKTAAQESLKGYWEYKYKKPDGMTEMVSSLVADPTIEPTLQPWPAESTSPPPATVSGRRPGVKVGTGAAEAGGGNGKKAAPAKGRRKH